jgi:hypothetical protein
MKATRSATSDQRKRPLTGNRLKSNFLSGFMTIDDIVNSESSKRQSILPKMAAAFAAANVGKVVGVNEAEGSLIYQYEPVVGDTYKVLNINLTNNDEGAIYDSGDLSLLAPLAQKLWDFVPANQANYEDIGEMVGAWNVNIRTAGDAQVYDGWNRAVNNDGSIDLTNIGGIPDVSYTTWRDSIGFPNQNTMALAIQIPLSQLELDGESGYDPLTDARIELGSVTNSSAFIASAGDGLNYWQGEGVNYDVIPEAGTSALMIGGAALLAYAAKRMHEAKGKVKEYLPAKK